MDNIIALLIVLPLIGLLWGMLALLLVQVYKIVMEP